MQPHMELSYLVMRRFLGFLGLLLPIALFVGGCFIEKGDCWKAAVSISAFYHSSSPLNGVFIGTVCAIGVFLVCYKGYDKDYWITLVAGLAAFGIALFPTIDHNLDKSLITCTDKVFKIIHYGSALLFFLALGVMSFFMFPKGQKKFPLENTLYRVYGAIIFLMIAVVAIVRICFEASIFLPETGLVWAFAFSWLLKGRGNRRVLLLYLK